jgi:hypothetical protein
MTRQFRSNIGAYLLIGLGILFLAGQTGLINIGDFFGSVLELWWPMFIFIPGVVFLLVAWFGKKTEGLAIPGAIITGTGAIMTVQNITNHWESWAYVWTLYPGLVGLALMYMGWRTNNTQQLDDGRKMAFASLLSCAVFFAIFEGLIFNNVFSWNLLPVVLIGLGVVLLFRSRLPGAKAKNAPIMTADKRKHLPTNDKPFSAADIDPELRRKIDEVLAEDTPPVA